MIILDSPSALREWRKTISPHEKIGFVPTMGALHEGHASLLERARQENKIVILSIFINPTQFNNPDDLAGYPKTWDADLAMAKRHTVDVIFAPRDEKELYPDQYRYQVTENQFSNELCGAHRPGHFTGVLTVVLKLFQLVQPHSAYFGEKDHQQLSLIQGMIEAFFLEIKLIPCATVREKSGLAMSSRNLRLSPEEKALAPKLYEIMKTVPDLAQATEKLNALGFKVEYLKDIKTRRYAAAWLGSVRLIDNVIL